ncbi:unnamed protein product [Cochlearia groenlandica]
MSKVVEMLEGSLEALQIPPKPLLSLPILTVRKTSDGSHETSSLLEPSHEDTSHYSEEEVQDIVEENQDSLGSY